MSTPTHTISPAREPLHLSRAQLAFAAAAYGVLAFAVFAFVVRPADLGRFETLGVLAATVPPCILPVLVLGRDTFSRIAGASIAYSVLMSAFGMALVLLPVAAMQVAALMAPATAKVRPRPGPLLAILAAAALACAVGSLALPAHAASLHAAIVRTHAGE